MRCNERQLRLRCPVRGHLQTFLCRLLFPLFDFFFLLNTNGRKKKTRCNRHLCPLLFLELKLAGTGSTSKNFQSSFKMPCLPISFHTSQSLRLTFSIGYIINFSYISLSNAYIKIKLQLKIKPKFAVCIQPYYN